MARSAAHIADSTRWAPYQDMLDAPVHRVAEIVDETLYTHPRPAPPHALANSSLQGDLSSAFPFGRGGPGGWWIIFEPELHLGEDIVVPDLAGGRREHMPELPDTAYFTLAPDWACEVLSASRLVTTRDHREGRGGRGYASARRETVRNSRCGRRAPQSISVSGPSSSSVNPLSSK